MNETMTICLKDIIKQKGLINTGALWRSIRVYTNIDNWDLVITIKSEDYLKYLWYKYGINTALVSSDEFRIEVQKLFQPHFQSWIEKQFYSGSFDDNWEPSVILKLVS
jgi:hypothetical protein